MNFIATEIQPNGPKNKMAEGQAMKEFCQKIFPDLNQNLEHSNFLEGRCILAATNKEVTMLNDVVIDLIPGNGSLLRSADELGHSEDLLRFNIEYLNGLSPTGFPPHSLRLKAGMPIMLLRNLNPRLGLCNGTKLIFERCVDNKLLQCKIIGSGRKVVTNQILLIIQSVIYCSLCPYLSFDYYNSLIGLSSFLASYSFHRRMNIPFPGRGGNSLSSPLLPQPSTNPKVKCFIGVNND